MWIFLASVFGLFKGVRDIAKKKAMERNGTAETLFVYTLLSFVLCTVIGFARGEKLPSDMDFSYLPFILMKSAVIFVAWICSFKAIHRLPIGFYGIMDMSRVVMAAVLSMLLLGEIPTAAKIIGMAVVLLGLLMVNLKRDEKNGGTVSAASIALVLVSCLMSAVSEIFDKFLMSATDITSGQLQFWYMLFLTVMYLLYLAVTKTRIDWKTIFKNYWLIIMSVLFVLGDRALFEACKYENSSVITLTLIKQCSVAVTVAGGYLVFREKHTLYRMLCAGIIICGIVVSVMQTA